MDTKGFKNAHPVLYKHTLCFTNAQKVFDKYKHCLKNVNAVFHKNTINVSQMHKKCFTNEILDLHVR